MPAPTVHRTAAVVENLLKHKWSRTILWHLREGVSDPVEISRIEYDIAPSTMSERLRTMVRHSLIQRVTRQPRAKTVLYHLTPKGRRILTVLELVSRLDAISESDPRPLEEIFYLGLRARISPPVLLAEDVPSAGAAPAPSHKKNSSQLVL